MGNVNKTICVCTREDPALLHMLFGAIVQNTHTHFLWFCNRKEGDALVVKFGTQTLGWVQPQVQLLFSPHSITPKVAFPGCSKKICEFDKNTD